MKPQKTKKAAKLKRSRTRKKEKNQSDFLQKSLPHLLGAGYGLFSKKAASPRWPEFFIAAFVIKKYREKSSFFFMMRAAIDGVRKRRHLQTELENVLLRLIGSTPREIYRLSGIHAALKKERGAAIAAAATAEIVRITNERRQMRKKKKNDQL